MADILIFYQDRNIVEGEIVLSGTAYASPDSGSIPWETTVSRGDLAATINAAMKTAAIAAADVAGYTVGALDKKTLLGGAVGL